MSGQLSYVSNILATLFICVSAIGCHTDSKKDLKSKLTKEDLEVLTEEIQLQVNVGFTPASEIPEFAAGALYEHDPKVVKPHAIRITKELIAKHLAEQAKWPKITDCDRLDAAFRELEEIGIVARHDFTDCQTCGNAEIWGEMEKVDDVSHNVRGYTYYHQQDSESAAQGYGICLAYGSVKEGDSASVSIGREVCNVLKRHSFRPNWNGKIEERIQVPMVWQRRR